ncbi:tRNA (adenosine(37)-N6)-threonylcarbamoyltransferase complex ATPase subunit type 1 TsaE [Acetobacteraceae bacterium KSS8]|uniref:tRNA threonylcarbamoyladenosine biosynthesis protein TsaE n=1 Tax=Endosaccharibacter trunci TaxID=2812733 RepID=A0ABT1WBH1_9PROT|nr:tRNA (adenosine(37)-N6)-threonylcarbamoyltransferase complex ATPase subunit type 1 TsaE [Acetobacteraceae bacterium KSS8]
MSPALTRDLPDLAATEAFGRSLASLLRPGDCILLDGPLGAGKTALARALLRAACGREAMEVPSPSYTLVQGYETPGGLPIHHFDLWRLDGPSALEELGWDEARDGVVLVEWPDRLGALTPEDALRLDLSLLPSSDPDPDAPAPRRVRVHGWAERLAAARLVAA